MVSKNKDVVIDMKSGVMRDADDGKKTMAANKNVSLKVSLAEPNPVRTEFDPLFPLIERVRPGSGAVCGGQRLS